MYTCTLKEGAFEKYIPGNQVRPQWDFFPLLFRFNFPNTGFQREEGCETCSGLKLLRKVTEFLLLALKVLWFILYIHIYTYFDL